MKVRLALLVALVALLFSAPVFAQTLADSLAVPATKETGPTLLDQIASTLAALIPILTVLVGSGLVAKYLPFAKGFSNSLIPFLNALIAFLAVFAGGPQLAQAGIFGDFVHALSFPAKAAGSLLLSGVAAGAYEVFIRHPLGKIGIFKAGLTAEEKAALQLKYNTLTA